MCINDFLEIVGGGDGPLTSPKYILDGIQLSYIFRIFLMSYRCGIHFLQDFKKINYFKSKFMKNI